MGIDRWLKMMQEDDDYKKSIKKTGRRKKPKRI